MTNLKYYNIDGKCTATKDHLCRYFKQDPFNRRYQICFYRNESGECKHKEDTMDLVGQLNGSDGWVKDKMKTKEPIKVQIKGQVPFSVLLTKNSNYVGICEPLKLTLQANTFSNLMEDMALTLDAIFKDLLSSNELDKFLDE